MNTDINLYYSYPNIYIMKYINVVLCKSVDLVHLGSGTGSWDLFAIKSAAVFGLFSFGSMFSLRSMVIVFIGFLCL